MHRGSRILGLGLGKFRAGSLGLRASRPSVKVEILAVQHSGLKVEGLWVLGSIEVVLRMLLWDVKLGCLQPRLSCDRMSL